MKDFDLNYYSISNLEKQINFNLLQLNYNENNSLDQKIKIITQYLNQNLNAQFIFDNNKMDKIDDFQSVEKINEINGIIYENKKEFNKGVRHFLDLNKELFAFCTENIIYLLSKENFKTKIEIKESEIKDIKYCQKIDNERFIIQIPNYFIIIKVINNIDYMIIQKYEIPDNYYSFNSIFDLIYLKVEKDDYYKNQKNYYIYFVSFQNIINNSKSNNYVQVNDNGRLQFIKNYHFFYFCNNILTLYEIKNNYNGYYFNKVLSNKLDYNYIYASIIELNNNFYCLNDGNKILLLNKKNLTLSKTISMNANNLGLFKISDNNFAIFEPQNKKLILSNYDVLMDGLTWNLKGSKNILNEEVYSVEKSKNYFICSTNRACILFEIKNKQNK